jgi:hypothetical protein
MAGGGLRAELRLRLYSYALLGVMVVAIPSSAAGASLYDFDEAVGRGVVDIIFNPRFERPLDELIDHLDELDPGIVNRFGFAFGGPNKEFLEQQAALLGRIRSRLPHSLMGAVFPQDVSKDYDVKLPCDTRGDGEYTAASMKADSVMPPHLQRFVRLDMSKVEAQDYEICLGKIYIRQGFTFLQFEGMPATVAHSSSGAAAVAGYKRVRDAVQAYGEVLGVRLYFSGDWQFARQFGFNATYDPARFFHTTIPELLPYQNRIPQPGVENGYTYVLSPKIIADRLASVPPYTKVMFYIDNWDPEQDDLRRLMELGAVNRRTLIMKSAQNAAAENAYFIPTVYHCEGCGPSAQVVGDPCEVLPNGKTQYDAYVCGDWSTIRRALAIQSHGSN